MRVGYNPHKDLSQDQSPFVHQVVVPVYIPNHEGYFKDSFRILKLCLDSLFATAHERTYFTVVSNGSAPDVVAYLEALLQLGKIQELLQIENIGKLNAIVKGLVGHHTPLLTITDADILFMPGWQQQTNKIFNALPKVGVVGLIPQFKMFERHCGNLIWSHIFKKSLRFTAVREPEALVRFYDSIGWKRNYNPDYLAYNLSLNAEGVAVLAGSGHAVATYKRDIFAEVVSYFGYKLGGDSELYLDTLPLEKDYWRVTTQDNYAFHMGNVLEGWMTQQVQSDPGPAIVFSAFKNHAKIAKWRWFFKNRIVTQIISIRFLYRIFLRLKRLPPQMIRRY